MTTPLRTRKPLTWSGWNSMTDRQRMTTELLTGMLRDGKTPAWELDRAFWAREREVYYPLTHYDLDHWEVCAREGDPAARAISDTGALLRHIEESWPKSRLRVAAQNGVAQVSLLITGLPVGVEGEFKGEAPLPELGRAVAIAFLRADEMAFRLQRRLFRVADIKVPPYQDWPIEQITPGRFGAVHHPLRLICATANSAEGAARHAGMNHKGEYGLMLCRERYEKAFPDAAPSPAPEQPTGAPTLHLFGTGGDYDLAIANGIISAAVPVTGGFDLSPGDPDGTARPAIEALDRISQETGDRAIIDNDLLGTTLFVLVSGDPQPELRIHGTLREYTEHKIRELGLDETHIVKRDPPADPEAESPVTQDTEDRFVWMVGTRTSVLRDAFTAGPDNAPDILKLGMREGEIMIGKDRRGEVRVVREMGPDGLVNLPGGLDALRADDSPEP